MRPEEIQIMLIVGAGLIVIFLVIKLWRVILGMALIGLLAVGALYYLQQGVPSQYRPGGTVSDPPKTMPNSPSPSPLPSPTPVPNPYGSPYADRPNVPRECGCRNKMEQCKSACSDNYNIDDSTGRRSCHHRCEEKERSCRASCR